MFKAIKKWWRDRKRKKQQAQKNKFANGYASNPVDADAGDVTEDIVRIAASHQWRAYYDSLPQHQDPAYSDYGSTFSGGTDCDSNPSTDCDGGGGGCDCD